MFPETIIHKIFETNSSFHVKKRPTGEVQILFFRRFLLVLTKFPFQEILCPKPLGNSWGNWLRPVFYYMLRFTCGESKICLIMEKSQNIQNPVKHFRMELFTEIVNGLILLAIFAKNLILHVWEGSEHAFEALPYYPGIRLPEGLKYNQNLKMKYEAINYSSDSTVKYLISYFFYHV